MQVRIFIVNKAFFQEIIIPVTFQLHHKMVHDDKKKRQNPYPVNRGIFVFAAAGLLIHFFTDILLN